MVPVLDSFLGMMNLRALSWVTKFYNKVVPKISRLLSLDWRPLLEPRLDYENLVAIDMSRVDMTMPLALRSGLDPGKVVRTLRGEYSGAVRDAGGILNKSVSVVSLEGYQYVKRILSKGCPFKLMFDEPKESKLKIVERGNQKSVLDNPDLVNTIIRREDRCSLFIPLHDWVCRFGPHLQYNSQGIMDLKRLRWDS